MLRVRRYQSKLYRLDSVAGMETSACIQGLLHLTTSKLETPLRVAARMPAGSALLRARAAHALH